MPRNGVNIFALQKLMGYSDLQVLPKTDDDVHMAHLRGNPVDMNFLDKIRKNKLYTRLMRASTSKAKVVREWSPALVKTQ